MVLTKEQIEEVRQQSGFPLIKPEECEILQRTALEIKPKVIVEVGSSYGTSSMILGSVAKEIGGHLYCIEPDLGRMKKWRENIQKMQLEDYVTMINQPSPWVDLNKIPSNIDYLFLDGCHRTRWVIIDYHFWERFVNVGGRIAFHDTWNTVDGNVGVQVREALEIILRNDSAKLKEVDKYTKGYGITVFQKEI